MSRPCYKSYLHLIQHDIEPNVLYSFTWLSTSPQKLGSGFGEKQWTIPRKTLVRARDAGELICASPHSTIVKGEWLLTWLRKTPAQRREFAQSKEVRQLRERRVRI
jgi:hypothetical protein